MEGPTMPQPPQGNQWGGGFFAPRPVQYPFDLREAARMGWVYGGFGAIPTWVPYGFIGLGSALMAVRMIEQLLTLLFEGTDSPLLHKPTHIEAIG